MSHLVSYYSQIESNLRRTASKGLISLLNHQQLEDLAFKYFGIKDEYGNIIGYQCPYSGKIYTDYQDIVLEHIVPVVSKGGTVLFNCIPTSKEVNGADQKGAKHLIDWWTSSSYWNQEAPLRLEKIVNYMLDAYDQVFKEYTIEEVESSYLDIETDESILDEEDKDINDRTEIKLLNQAKNNGIHSYLGFIYDCINTLEKCNINTSNIKERLQQLQNQNIFKDIDKYQLYQNIIQKLVVSRIGDNNSSYLTYTLNFDIKKLMDSINLDNEQDIYNELNRRLQNIEQLLKENNLSTIEYFKSLKDIQDIDIIYKNNISSEEIQSFLENIKIGLDTKIDIFINMLNQGNDKILKKRNTETLEGYQSISLFQFWNVHKDRIKQKLFIDLKDKPEYDNARKLIVINEITINVDKQIPIFIDMLNKGNSTILKDGNKETLDGFPNIKLSYFWQNNKDKIKEKLYIELKDKPEYDNARKLIEINEITINVDKQIPIFIDMLNKGNSIILKQGNTETLKGYPNIKLSYFWNRHQEKIKHKLFIELKNNPEYDNARKLIAINEITINVDKQIPIFIDMLNKGNTNILKARNKETLEGYPNIKLSYFWDSHQDKIKQKLFIELKDNPEYDIARKLIEINEMSINIDKQIPIFIDMLNKGNSMILKRGNTETLDGYPNIKLSYFWSRYQDKIKQKLFIELKDNSEYDNARKLIAINEIRINVDKQIPIFIDMLNKGNSAILKHGNKEALEGYPNINLSQFWSIHKDRIKQKLFIDLKDKPEYDNARKLIEINEMSINIDKQIPIFIDMLNKGNSIILKQGNTETLKGYPDIKLYRFWNRHQDKIKEKLYVELKDNPEYDNARKLIEINEMSINIDKQIQIFINMLNKGNDKILKKRNAESLEGFSSIKLSYFWQNNKDKIKHKLFIELKDNPEYDNARKLIAINEITINVDKQIPLFIDMLNKGNTNILKARNKESLEGYPSINLSQFWSMHKERIKEKLFIELKDNPEYNIARQTVLTYFKVSSYEELEAKQNKGKKLQEQEKLQQELIESIEYIDKVDLTEQEQRKRA